MWGCGGVCGCVGLCVTFFFAQVHELEDFMDMQIAAVREDNADLLEKKRLKLIALQERRLKEANEGKYGDLVWNVVLQRLTESEIFVACLTPQYFADDVCRKEVAFTASLGINYVQVNLV